MRGFEARGVTYVTVSAQLRAFWRMLSFMVYLGPDVSGEWPISRSVLQVALSVLGAASPSHLVVVLECQTDPSNQTVKVQ